MILDYSKNLTPEMATPKGVACRSPQSAEVLDLARDYEDFCKHLREEGITEIVPLMEFAIWRNQEFEAQDDWTNPIPAIN